MVDCTVYLENPWLINQPTMFAFSCHRARMFLRSLGVDVVSGQIKSSVAGSDDSHTTRQTISASNISVVE